MQKTQSLLVNLTNNNNEVRKAAEKNLNTLETNPTFVQNVFQILCSPVSATYVAAEAVGKESNEALIRQMAAIIFSRIVQRHWITTSAGIPPVFTSVIKNKVRDSILKATFSSVSTKTRNDLANVVGHIAKMDYPDKWPALFPSLFQVLTMKDLGAESTASMVSSAAFGSLRCLTIIAEDICDETLFKVMPLVLPPLLRIAATPTIGIIPKKDVVCIATAFLQGLSTLITHDQAKTMSCLQNSNLAGWLEFSLQVLKAPLSAKLCGLKRRVLELHDVLLSGYSKVLLAENVKAMVKSQTHNLALYNVVQARALLEHDIDPPADDSGEKLRFEPIAMMTMGCIRRIISSKVHRKLFGANDNHSSSGSTESMAVQTLTFFLPFARVSAEQLQRWQDDEDTYNIDEDGTDRVTEMDGNEGCGTAMVRRVVVDLVDAISNRLRDHVPIIGLRKGTWRVGSYAVALAVSQLLKICSEAVLPQKISAKALAWRMEEVAIKIISLLKATLQSQYRQRSKNTSPRGRLPVGSPIPISVDILLRRAMQRMSVYFTKQRTNVCGGGINSSPDSSMLSSSTGDAHILQQHYQHMAYLIARYFWFCSDMVDCMNSKIRATFVGPCEMAMHTTSPLCLQLCGVRLVYKFAKRVVRARQAQAAMNKGTTNHSTTAALENCGADFITALSARLSALLQGVCGVMQKVGSENLHICLETISILLQVDTATSGVTAKSAVKLIPPLMKLWTTNTSHPMNATCLMDVFRKFAKVPTCLPTLLRELTPVIGRVIGDPTNSESKYNSSIVEGCVDLLHVLLCAHGELRAVIAVSPSVTGSNMASNSIDLLMKAYEPVLRLTMHTSDHTILHSLWWVLRSYIRQAPKLVAMFKLTRLTPGNSPPASKGNANGIILLARICARFLEIEKIKTGVVSDHCHSIGSFTGLWNDSALGQVGFGIGGLCSRVLALAVVTNSKTIVSGMIQALVRRLMVTNFVALKGELIRPLASLIVSNANPARAASHLLWDVIATIPFIRAPISANRRKNSQRNTHNNLTNNNNGIGANIMSMQASTTLGTVLQAWIDVVQEPYFAPYVRKLLTRGLVVVAHLTKSSPGLTAAAIAGMDVLDRSKVLVSSSQGDPVRQDRCLMPFRQASMFVVLDAVATTLVMKNDSSSKGGGAEGDAFGEQLYDFDNDGYDSCDDSYDGASGDSCDGAYAEEGILLSDIADMGGMAALCGAQYDEDESDMFDEEVTQGEDGEDDRLDPVVGQGRDLDIALIDILPACQSTIAFQNALRQLPQTRVGPLKKYFEKKH